MILHLGGWFPSQDGFEISKYNSGIGFAVVGLLLDERKRQRGSKLKGSENRYKPRMVAADWAEGGDAVQPESRTPGGGCGTKRATVWTVGVVQKVWEVVPL